MDSSETLQTKKQIAMGRNKDAALRVIMPRLIGAMKHESLVVHDENGTQLIANKGQFYIRLCTEAHAVNLTVWHRAAYGSVFSARLYSDGSGTALDGRVYVIGWQRSADARPWQAELFETFHRDSTWLLDIPQKVIRPEIVAAVLSHIASQTIRSV